MSAPAKYPPSESLLARRHALFGWWSLLVFLSIGIVLEALHGLKIGWYLEPAYSTRRLMWTLSHAHGTLLAVIHGLFAVSILSFPGQLRIGWASPCLIAASLLLPGGFFLGGIFVYGGDPGIGVFLVPLGAAALLTAVLLMALELTRSWPMQTSAAGAPDDSRKPVRPKRK